MVTETYTAKEGRARLTFGQRRKYDAIVYIIITIIVIFLSVITSL